MKRVLGTRLPALGVLFVVAACGSNAKARADSVAAAAHRDSVAAVDALAARAREDSVAAASSKKTGSAKTTATKTNAKTGDTKILGRDSVRQGPIIGLPSIKDTAKKKP